MAAEGAARAAKAALVNTPLAALRVAQLPVAPQLGDRWRSMAAAHKELRNDISESKRLHALVSGLEANGAARTAREADWCTQETQRLRDQLSAQSRVFIDAGADEAEQAAVERAAADDAISRAEITAQITPLPDALAKHNYTRKGAEARARRGGGADRAAAGRAQRVREALSDGGGRVGGGGGGGGRAFAEHTAASLAALRETQVTLEAKLSEHDSAAARWEGASSELAERLARLLDAHAEEAARAEEEEEVRGKRQKAQRERIALAGKYTELMERWLVAAEAEAEAVTEPAVGARDLMRKAPFRPICLDDAYGREAVASIVDAAVERLRQREAIEALRVAQAAAEAEEELLRLQRPAAAVVSAAAVGAATVVSTLVEEREVALGEALEVLRGLYDGGATALKDLGRRRLELLAIVGAVQRARPLLEKRLAEWETDELAPRWEKAEKQLHSKDSIMKELLERRRAVRERAQTLLAQVPSLLAALPERAALLGEWEGEARALLATFVPAAALLAEEEKMALLSLEMVKRERERPPAVPHAAADSCDDDDDDEEEEMAPVEARGERRRRRAEGARGAEAERVNC